MTLSPTVTSSGTRLPLSSMRPWPTARTSPSWGFSLAVSGMTRPEAVVVSASRALTTIRSSSGLMGTDTSDLLFREQIVDQLRWVDEGSSVRRSAVVAGAGGHEHLAAPPPARLGRTQAAM